MTRVRATAADLLVRASPIVASLVSGDGSGKGLIESAYDPKSSEDDNRVSRIAISLRI